MQKPANSDDSRNERRRTVGVLIFDDVEVLDFCGPFEVFSVARPAGENDDDLSLFTAVIIAERPRVISCRGGLLVQSHATIDAHPPLDILVVPGGQGTHWPCRAVRARDVNGSMRGSWTGSRRGTAGQS